MTNPWGAWAAGMTMAVYGCVAYAQPAPEQDCINAIAVCQMSYYQPNSYIGVGNIPGELPPNGCLAVNERHGAWYIFTIESPGLLNFLITPNNLNDDYDWAVYHLTNRSCSEIRTNLSLQVSCNYSGQRGVTGTLPGATQTSQGSGGSRFNAPIPVNAGETYVLYVSNFSQTQFGYTLDFNTSTAVITDLIPPSFVGVESPVPCASNQLTVRFSENVLCQTVQPSDFSLSGGAVNYTVTAVNAACDFSDERSYAQTFVLTVSPPFMQSGALTINLVGEITDICGNAAAAASFPFTLSVDLPLTVSPSSPTLCAGGSVTLTAAGATLYNWAPNVGLSQTTGAVVTASPSQTTSYTLFGTQNGCTDSEFFTVTVHPNPSVNVSPSSPVVCAGQTVTLTATGAESYIWNPATGLDTAAGPTVVATPQQSTVYTLVATDANGCSATRTVLVTALTPPFINATTQQNGICAGTSTTLNVTGGTGYQWSPATGLNTTAGASVIASPTETTTYTVTGMNPANQCPATDTITVFVRQPPMLVLTPPQATICAGGAVNLSAAGATTYTWSPPTGLNTTNGPNVVASPNQSRTYTVVATGNGCTVVGTVPVTVVSNPTINVSPSQPTICLGGSVTLTASGAEEYTWAPETGLSATTGATVTAQPTTTTTYTVRGTNGNCAGERTVTVNVAQPPTIDATAPNNAVCQGGSITLTATGGTNYVWQPGGLSGPSVTVAPAQTTTYTVSGTNAGGNCTSSDTFTVFVRPNTQVTVNPPGMTLCLGTSQTLTASGAQIYSWSPATGLSQTTGPTVVASPAQTTTYTVTGINNGCTSQAVVTVIVTGSNVSVNTPEPLCPGQSAQLTATGATNYTWQPPAGLNTAAGPTVVASPAQTTTYTVTGITGGCISTATVTVVVQNAGQVSVNTPEPLCPGQSAQLTATGATNYTWQPPAGLNTTTGANVVASPAQTTTYTVTGITGGCISTATVTVVVQNAGQVSVNTPEPLCPGQSAQLTATGATNYTWQPPAGLNTSAGPNVVASPAQTTTYTVTGITGGCISTATVTVVVQNAGQVAVNQPEPLCPGQSAQLTATGATNYTWQPPAGLNTTTGANVVASPAQTTTYTVTGITGGCISTATVTVVVQNAGQVSVNTPEPLCPGQSAQLTATGATNYTWQPPAGLNTSAGPNVVASPAQTTTYTVTGITGGCISTATVTVVVQNAGQVAVNQPEPLCPGQSAQLTATGATNYTWQPPAGLNTAAGPNVVASPAQTTTYTVTGITGGCVSTATVTVVVQNAGQVSVNTPEPLCPGQSAQLTATGAANYTWQPPAGLNTAAGPNVVASPAQTTTYTVTGITGGCVSTATVTVVVQNAGQVSVNTPEPLCPGQSAQLTATGAANYTWQPPAGLNTSAGSNVVASPAQTTTYTVTGITGGCVSTATVTVVVQNAGQVSVNTPEPLCPGQSAQLTATGAANYTWQPPAGLNTSAGSNVVASPAQTTTYTVTGITGGCVSTATVTVVVQNAGQVSVNTPEPLCPGQSAQLTATGATNYTWQPPAGLNTAAGPTVVATPAQTTTYTVTGITGGCISTATVTVVVQNAGQVSVNTPEPLCPGQSAQLTATGATNYTWQPPAGLNTAAGPNVVATPAQTTTYTVTGITGGCISTATVTVVVQNAGQVSVNTPEPLCPGQSAQLTATGATNYTWQPPVGLNTAAGPNVVASPAQTTTYTVTGITGGCISTATVTVVVQNAGQVAVNTPEPLCPGQSAQLTATGATNYTWHPPAGLNTAAGPTVVASPAQTTTYTVTGITGGCVSQTTVTVTVINTGNLNVTQPGGPICAGESTTLIATGAQSYSWQPTTGLNNPNGAVVTASPSQTTTYTVTGITGGCVSTATVTVEVGVGGNVTITPQNPTICQGNTTTLTAEGGTSYQWSPATGLSSTTSGTVTAGPGQTTTYTVIAVAGGCTVVRTVTVTVVTPQSILIFPPEPTICAGGNVNLSASGAQTYSWSPATGLSSTTGSVVTAQPNQTTVYTVTAVTAQGCTTSRTVTVQVVAQLNVFVTPSQPAICQGRNTVLTASGATHYSWSPAAGLSSTTGASVTCNTQTTRTYTVTGTSGGCSAQAFVTVTVYPLPNPQITASATQLCSGQSATLSATGATHYSWSPAAGLSSTTGAHVIAAPSQTTTYTLVGESNGCETERTITLSVLPRPNVAVTPSDATLCVGGATTLTATGAQSYVWAPATGLNATTGANVVASPNQTTTYTVTGTGVNGCTAAASATVTVVPLPSLTVNPPAPVRCANGAGVSLTVSGGSQYLWQPATGLNTTTGQTVVATPSQTTTYTVRNTTPGCESQTTVTVTVHAAPQVTVTPSPAEVCPGESVVITASGTATSYLWSPPEGLNTTVGPTVAASPSQSMVYTLTAVAHGCTTTREVPVNVKAPVNLTAAAESWGICRGEATNVTVVGAQSYAWHPPGGVTQIGAGLYRLSPQTTTVYTLMGTTAGCTAQTTITITVEEPVTVTATAPPQPICPGTAATLQATGNGAQYVWSPPTGLNATTGATVTASPTQTTTYTVRAYSLGGFCVSAAATTVQVVPTPAIVPSIPPPTLCAGESVTVALTGAAQYEWNPSLEGGAAQGNDTFVLSPAQTTVYTISGISSNGCPVRLEYAVRVNPLPEVTVTAERTSLCRGESVRLEATGAVMYEWYPGGEVHSGPYRTVKPQETQTYTVVGTDANGCRDTTQITITVAPRPRITAMPPEAVCEGETARIAATGASVYRILPDGAEGDTAVFHPERSGFYRLEGTNEYGCKDTVSVYVRVNALPQLTIKPAEAKICAGETLVLTASGAVRYAWKDETGEGLGEGDTLIFAPPRTQTIILEGTDANGCPNVKLTTITVLGLPEAYEFPDTAVCRGESVRIQPHSHADILFRVFSMPTGGRSLTSELVRHWDTPPVEIQRTYWLETVKDGCVSAYRTPVTVTPLPRPFVPDLPVQTVCKGKELTLWLPDTLHYLWVLPEVGDVHRGPTLHFRADSTTTFYVYSDNGTCNGWRPAKVRIVVYPEPGLVIAAAPDTLYAGEPVTFTAYADTNVIGFLWEVNGKNYYGNPMTFVFPDSGGFDLKLTAYTTEGCVYIFTKNVGVREPNVIPGFPDAFTPNGDGINDVYELKFRNAPRRFEMRIFDRWGMQVAYSTNPERIWDGMHPSGIPVPEGVYAFTLRLEMPNGIVVAKRGTITLLR